MICVGAPDEFDARAKAALEALGNDGGALDRELEGPGVKGGVFMMKEQVRTAFRDH